MSSRNHPGRQSPVGAGKRPLFSKTLAPSAIPVNLGDGCIAGLAGSIVFGTPKEMDHDEIELVIRQFAHAAKVASLAGLQGVEVHVGRKQSSARLTQRD